MKSKPTTPIPVRISDQTLGELKRISVEQDRAVGWLIRFACEFLVNAYKKDPDVVRPTSAETQQASSPAAPAPDPVVAALAESEWFKEIVAELKAKLDRPAELKTKPNRKPVLGYRFLPKGGSHPVKSVEPAVAVPPTSISKHNVKH
jgi:hypothetical protein